MIEILNIFFLIFCFSILLSNNFTINLIINKLNLKNLSLITKYSINALIIMLFLLIASFFSVKIIYVAATLFIMSFMGLFNKKKIKLFSINIFLINYLLFFILCFILSVDLVANPKLEWDGHEWYFKALNFKENLNFFNLSISDRNQPHLGGILWGIFWQISFFDYEFYGRIFYTALYVCAILSVSENVSKIILNRIIISIILIFLTYDKFLFSGYQEVLVFSIIVIICNILNKLDLKKLNIFQIIFLIIVSSLLLWSKNDGLIFFTIITTYLIYFQNFKNKLLFLSLGIFLIFLKYYLININDISGFTFQNENLVNLDLKLFYEKFVFIFFHIIIAMFKYPIWILFIFIFVINREFKKNFEVLFFASISVFFIFFVFMVYDIYDYKWLVRGSLDRLMFQASGFILIFASKEINLLFGRSKN